MCMQKIKESLQSLWSTWTMSAEERWLSQSADIIELEQKLRQLWTPNQNYNNHTGV